MKETAANAHRIRWGTSSWSEKSWVGSFYPAGTKPADFLPYYATHFDTVEVDSTYYAIPELRTVEGWERKLPAGFLMSAKFPRSIVHAGEGARPDPERVLLTDAVWDDVELFLARMRILGEKCGPLVLQLPFFNRTAFRSQEPFLERLGGFLEALPEGFRYAVEVRNKEWLGPRLIGLLRRHQVALVLVDLSYMPHPADVALEMDLRTTSWVYVRLIGDRKLVEARTKSFDHIVVDQGARLGQWSKLLHAYRESVPEILVYANNHYAGHGPATIRALRTLVGSGESGESDVPED